LPWEGKKKREKKKSNGRSQKQENKPRLTSYSLQIVSDNRYTETEIVLFFAFLCLHHSSTLCGIKKEAAPSMLVNFCNIKSPSTTYILSAKLVFSGRQFKNT